jgi:hypothetical protein
MQRQLSHWILCAIAFTVVIPGARGQSRGASANRSAEDVPPSIEVSGVKVSLGMTAAQITEKFTGSGYHPILGKKRGDVQPAYVLRDSTPQTNPEDDLMTGDTMWFAKGRLVEASRYLSSSTSLEMAYSILASAQEMTPQPGGRAICRVSRYSGTQNIQNVGFSRSEVTIRCGMRALSVNVSSFAISGKTLASVQLEIGSVPGYDE